MATTRHFIRTDLSIQRPSGSRRAFDALATHPTIPALSSHCAIGKHGSCAKKNCTCLICNCRYNGVTAP